VLDDVLQCCSILQRLLRVQDLLIDNEVLKTVDKRNSKGCLLITPLNQATELGKLIIGGGLVPNSLLYHFLEA
jgi:hypothetical protein